MMSPFDSHVHQEFLDRLITNSPTVESGWGEMSRSIMLEHHARGLEVETKKRGMEKALLGELIG